MKWEQHKPKTKKDERWNLAKEGKAGGWRTFAEFYPTEAGAVEGMTAEDLRKALEKQVRAWVPLVRQRALLVLAELGEVDAPTQELVDQRGEPEHEREHDDQGGM